ncbi:MAG TPA: endolytic transglycosylase MltG, partial [Solirubrobacteraceae bacterium]|nr:endolytic transglycosylase MltG [Solirubrobacteraceae bacterium]
YNTRVHTGLPPTPIDSPSLASIQAAAHPAPSNALYFVATPCGNGRSTFTASYQQFLIDSRTYANARAARGGKSPVSCK